MTKIMELFDLSGRSALVTGGATGIGFAMAEGLAEAGASVTICGRGRHGNLDEAKNMLSETGSEILALKCDVSIEDDVVNMVKSLRDNYSSLEILVNNSGISWGHPSESLSLNDFQKVVDVNLKGAFLVSREIAKNFMIPAHSGAIINIASISGYLGGEVGVLGYSASKAGLIGMTKQLAIEWAPYGIRVNAIAPSWFPSYMSRYFTSDDSPFKEILIKENPMGRLGEPWELKGVVIFLAGNASSYINGVTIPVDGGLLCK